MDLKSAVTLSHLSKTDLETEADKETYFTRINPPQTGLCFSKGLISERECGVARCVKVLDGGEPRVKGFKGSKKQKYK